MSQKKSRTFRIYTDASYYPSKKKPCRSAGAIVVVGADGTPECGFFMNYTAMNLESCSVAETLTMTLALEKFRDQAVSITGDSLGDINRMIKLFSGKEAFNEAATSLPAFLKRRIRAVKDDVPDAVFQQDSRKNQYIRIADKLAERAVFAAPGVLYEIPFAKGRPCAETLDFIAPLPPGYGMPEPSPYGG